MSQLITNPVINAILFRRSIRSYKPDKIDDEQLNTVLQCGNWAPSGRNAQTTILVASQNMALFQQLSNDFRSSSFAPPPPPRNPDVPVDLDMEKFSYGAPSFIFVYGDSTDRWYQVNAALAVENMVLAANSLGLSTVIVGMVHDYMNSSDGQKWKTRFGVPEHYEFVCGLSLGYGSETGEEKPRKEGTILMV